MKTAVAIVLLLGLAATAYADCPNACSGHGTCGTKDKCTCYPNWQAADCSERTCPFGLSFVDTPQGDLNHDGTVNMVNHGVSVIWNTKKTWEQFPGSYNTPYIAAEQEAHFYSECSNKGLCDRESGECQCFDGYEGSSCQRTVCPNGCSGHGVCRTVAEIATGKLNEHVLSRVADQEVKTGVATSFTYNLWDHDKNQGCVCDPGYTAPDCSRRECPRGDDPITHQNKNCAGAACTNEVQTLTINPTTASASQEFKFGFKDWTGKTWYTDVVTAYGSGHASFNAANNAAAFDTALEAIPNSVFEAVTHTVSTSGNGIIMTITFTTNPGDINLLTLHCMDAGSTNFGSCGGDFDVAAEFATAQSTAGNKEEVTCSNRGLCDYETGLCGCFKGYYGDDCSLQSILAV